MINLSLQSTWIGHTPFYVYLIKIKNRTKHSYYVGYTSNLRKRILEYKENKGEIMKLINQKNWQEQEKKN